MGWGLWGWEVTLSARRAKGGAPASAPWGALQHPQRTHSPPGRSSCSRTRRWCLSWQVGCCGVLHRYRLSLKIESFIVVLIHCKIEFLIIIFICSFNPLPAIVTSATYDYFNSFAARVTSTTLILLTHLLVERPEQLWSFWIGLLLEWLQQPWLFYPFAVGMTSTTLILLTC